MDNIQDTAVDPQGQSAPVEQMPSVQPAEVPAEVQQKPAGTTFEELAAKQGFKSPDDLAAAYANLRSQNTKVEMKNAEFEKLYFSEQPKDTFQQPKLAEDEQQKALNELDKFVSERTQRAVQEAESKFRTELSRIELRNTLEKHPDFGKYAQDIKELRSKYPDMPFGEAYAVAKALKGDSISEAKAEGLKQGTYMAQKQFSAGTVQSKPVAEEEVPITEKIQGAGTRWAQANRKYASPDVIARVRAEQELIERQLLEKGATGLEWDQAGIQKLRR